MSAPDFWDVLPVAAALMLVAEGALPFFSPTSWRRLFERAMKMSDGQLRFVGLSCMLSGLLLLYVLLP